MNLLVVSSSLNPDSNSRILAREAERVLAREKHSVTFLDLRELTLPLCDGSTAYGHPNVINADKMIAGAEGILVASPIYNYDANAAVKNLIELTGDAWENKVVAFMCAAGGHGSYMSIMAVANSLMLDFRCVVVPRFVYATDPAFSGDKIVDAQIAARVEECALALARFSAALLQK